MPLHTKVLPFPERSTRSAGKTMPDMRLHRTNSRGRSTPGVRGSSAHRFLQNGNNDWDQNDFRCIRVRIYLSAHFARTRGLVIVARGHWLVVGDAPGFSLRSAES